MQQIPSPDTSTTEIPLPGPRQEVSNVSDAPQASETNMTSSEKLDETGAPNGITIKSSPNGFPSLSPMSETTTKQSSLQGQDLQIRPPSAIPREVSLRNESINRT